MKTIFVVDDVDTNLAEAKEILRNQYRVFTFSSAVDMFALLEKVVPDLILMDIEMPGMSGIQAAQHLKSSDSSRNIPVVFLTGHGDSVTQAHCLEIGAVDFIKKPFTELAMRNRIQAHLDADNIIGEQTTHTPNSRDEGSIS